MLEIIIDKDGKGKVVPDAFVVTLWRNILSMTYMHPVLIIHPDMNPFRQIFIENDVIHESSAMEIFLPYPIRDEERCLGVVLRPSLPHPLVPAQLIFGEVFDFTMSPEGITLKSFRLSPSVQKAGIELAEFIRAYPMGILYDEAFGFIYDFLVRFGIKPRVIEYLAANSPPITLPPSTSSEDATATDELKSSALHPRAKTRTTKSQKVGHSPTREGRKRKIPSKGKVMPPPPKRISSSAGKKDLKRKSSIELAPVNESTFTAPSHILAEPTNPTNCSAQSAEIPPKIEVSIPHKIKPPAADGGSPSEPRRIVVISKAAKSRAAREAKRKLSGTPTASNDPPNTAKPKIPQVYVLLERITFPIPPSAPPPPAPEELVCHVAETLPLLEVPVPHPADPQVATLPEALSLPHPGIPEPPVPDATVLHLPEVPPLAGPLSLPLPEVPALPPVPNLEGTLSLSLPDKPAPPIPEATVLLPETPVPPLAGALSPSLPKMPSPSASVPTLEGALALLPEESAPPAPEPTVPPLAETPPSPVLSVAEAPIPPLQVAIPAPLPQAPVAEVQVPHVPEVQVPPVPEVLSPPVPQGPHDSAAPVSPGPEELPPAVPEGLPAAVVPESKSASFLQRLVSTFREVEQSEIQEACRALAATVPKPPLNGVTNGLLKSLSDRVPMLRLHRIDLNGMSTPTLEDTKAQEAKKRSNPKVIVQAVHVPLRLHMSSKKRRVPRSRSPSPVAAFL